jgi:hypothetical protein
MVDKVTPANVIHRDFVLPFIFATNDVLNLLFNSPIHSDGPLIIRSSDVCPYAAGFFFKFSERKFQGVTLIYFSAELALEAFVGKTEESRTDVDEPVFQVLQEMVKDIYEQGKSVVRDSLGIALASLVLSKLVRRDLNDKYAPLKSAFAVKLKSCKGTCQIEFWTQSLDSYKVVDQDA